MQTLHLLKSEQSVFEKLSSALKEGWTVETENGKFEDSPAEMSLRQCLVHFPSLQEYKGAAAKATSVDELSTILQKEDMSSFTDDEIHDMLFVLGPNFLTKSIGEILKSVKTDEDISGLASLSTLRHLQLHEFALVSA